MDDTSGIRLLAGLVDIVRNKDGSGELLSTMAAHEAAAMKTLAKASEVAAAANKDIAVARALRDESNRARDEMRTKLVPREAEVAAGAQSLQKNSEALNARDKDTDTREKELTRRENAMSARERKIAADETALKTETDRVGALRADYEARVEKVKKAIGG